MNTSFQSHLETEIQGHKEAGTLKELRHLDAPMSAHTNMREAGGEVVVLSSNNYLGLANHPHVVASAKNALEKYGNGTASVRFICGTMTIHEELEEKLAKFHGTESCMTYPSCWSANTGLFPTICKPGDVLLSDELNHASIIDGCRLVSKAVQRDVYKHSDMADLEAKLKASQDAPNRFVVTDGVFSMEGDIAKLPELVKLCKTYNAVLIVDDCHGVGVLGETGKGITQHFGLEGQVDIITGTVGKALGGAAGGYICGSKELTQLLVQNSRPHLFSNAISPATAGGTIGALEALEREPELMTKLHANVKQMRDGLKALGFKPLDGESAIIPIIVGDTALAIQMADEMLKQGFFVTGFGFPVVPEGAARLRIQMSAALSELDISNALDALAIIGKKHGLI
ncbi:MAG: glycine C-acetyltransferase [Pseudomonadota bacterium]|nr:glycine C-acetyltransferase [Pseudomonadota bacterium]